MFLMWLCWKFFIKIYSKFIFFLFLHHHKSYHVCKYVDVGNICKNMLTLVNLVPKIHIRSRYADVRKKKKMLYLTKISRSQFVSHPIMCLFVWWKFIHSIDLKYFLKRLWVWAVPVTCWDVYFTRHTQLKQSKHIKHDHWKYWNREKKAA